MIKYDYGKLLGKMKERSETQKGLAIKIGLCECSLNASLKNRRDFKQSEITQICEILQIDPSNVEEYFFTPKL